MFNYNAPDWRKPYRASQKRLRDLQAGEEPWQKKGQSALKMMRERLYGKGTRAFPGLRDTLQQGLRSNLRSRGLNWGSTAEDVGNERIQEQVKREQEQITQGEKDYQDALQEAQEAVGRQAATAREYGTLQGDTPGMPGAAKGLQEQINDLMDQGRYGEVIGALASYESGPEDSVLTAYARDRLQEARKKYFESRR